MPNTESNGYTILFSVIMVVVVGVSLAMVAQFTAPFQEKNIEEEKKQNILAAVNVRVNRSEAAVNYDKYIVKEESVVFNSQGEKVEGTEPFDIDLAAELKKPEDQQQYPLFVAKLDDGKKYFIIPMRGKGLWDAIWGYVSVSEDGLTVAGATFDHKGETPGLGAEIAQPNFQSQFPGKKIVSPDGEFKSISVNKPGKNPPGYEYGVDGISGGTITSNGVNDMLIKYFKAYRNYVEKNATVN